MEKPDPEMIDDDNPEWTEQDFARAVPFSSLPTELQQVLQSEARVVPDGEKPSKKQPAA